MKTLYESLLDDEDIVMGKMGSHEEDLLWKSTSDRYQKAFKRRVSRKYPCDRFGREVGINDWLLYGFSLYRVVDIKMDDNLINLQGCDNVKDISVKDLMSYVKIVDKIRFAQNFSA